MHPFTELVDRSTAFTLAALSEASHRTVDALQESAATPLVKTLQMLRLQKVILAVGMFSIFEASLQRDLDSQDGFKAAGQILDQQNETVLRQMFSDVQRAINVLKHGRGRSYDKLLEKVADLPFRIKMPDEHFFAEGDVSGIATLVEVDDTFVQMCADLIRDVTLVLQVARPDFAG